MSCDQSWRLCASCKSLALGKLCWRHRSDPALLATLQQCRLACNAAMAVRPFDEAARQNYRATTVRLRKAYDRLKECS